MDWLGVTIGAGIGFALSLALWWLQYRVLVPRISFASGIGKIPDEPVPNYRVKFTNTGRRSVIDVTIDVRVFFGKGVIEYESRGPLSRTSYSMKILTSSSTQSGIMRIPPGASRVLRLDLRRSTWDDVNPRLLKTVGLADSAPEQSVDLEQLLGAVEGANLRIRLLAYDEVSGTRKFFQSGRYWAEDIHEGVFDGLLVKSRGLRPVVPEADNRSDA